MDPHDALDGGQDDQRPGDDPEAVDIPEQEVDGGRDEDEDLEVADQARQRGGRVGRRHRRHGEAHGGQPQHQGGDRAERTPAEVQQPPRTDQHRDTGGDIGRSHRRAAALAHAVRQGGQQHGRDQGEQRPPAPPPARGRAGNGTGRGPGRGGGQRGGHGQLPPSRKKEPTVRASTHASCHRDQVSM
ncbi:hypothetical protein SMICM304S_10447 [Streptomyces microflavus]